MPTYEYFCEDCNYHFEEFKKMDEAGPQTNCPKCSKIEATRRVFSPVGIMRAGTSRDTVDRLIGAEAEKRWEDINDRKKQKDKIRKESGNQAIKSEIKKDDSGKINYEYKSVNKERIEERKTLYSEFSKQEKP
jgi:putative FmdB family regulatory protein